IRPGVREVVSRLPGWTVVAEGVPYEQPELRASPAKAADQKRHEECEGERRAEDLSYSGWTDGYPGSGVRRRKLSDVIQDN
ncbi:hypothetical protein ANCDUO_16291, partial [Ancylostoma duodenale]